MKKFIIILVALLLLTACSSNSNINNLNNDKKGKYQSLTIKANITNKNVAEQSYSIYLLTPGAKEIEAGKATQGGFYGPFETNDAGEITIDMENDSSIGRFIEGIGSYPPLESKKKNCLQVIITTREDIYLRNPLNKETYIEFIKNNETSTKYESYYYSTIENITIDATDKYPDGVVAISYPEATFAIKLLFNTQTNKAYTVSIYKPSDASPDGRSPFRIGRIARDFNYWETPFYKDDKMEAWGGIIVVEDFETGKEVSYEGYPKKVTFNKAGKCEQGDIIEIKILN